ncbi:MAG: hypothetical protein ACR2ID_05610 [Chthoniobacterales bacterium]
MPAANLAVLLAVLLSATGFFCTCRLLHYRLVWSVAGAALYAFSHYAWHRGLDHLELTYVGHLPLALLATWWLAAGVVRTFSDWRAGFILALGLFSGLQNVYYTNVILQLAVFALLANLIRARSDKGARQTAVICVAFFAAVVGGFIIGNADTFCFNFFHGKNPAVLVRGYSGTEIYALKPLEMFLPGVSHRLSALRGLTNEYIRVTMLRGEIRSGYLGLAGIVGLLWLICRVLAFCDWRESSTMADWDCRSHLDYDILRGGGSELLHRSLRISTFSRYKSLLGFHSRNCFAFSRADLLDPYEAMAATVTGLPRNASHRRGTLRPDLSQ